MKLGLLFLLLLPWATNQLIDGNQAEGDVSFEKQNRHRDHTPSSTRIKTNTSFSPLRRKHKIKQNHEKAKEQEQHHVISRDTKISNQLSRKSPPLKGVPPKERGSAPGVKRKRTKMERIERKRRGRTRHRHRNDISLWIDETQVRRFSGYNMEIYAIIDGRVMPYILDPEFEDQLPVIPSEVENVNFTWKSDRTRYYYNFDLLTSFDQTILDNPFVSIKKRGRVPRRPKVFSVRIPCAGNVSGVATFGIGLKLQNSKGVPLPDTPLRLRLRKKCELTAGPYPACDEKCENGGVCDVDRRCHCPMGYMGTFCNTALCYPKCRNEGICSAPGRCSCPTGYHGRICEGGICRSKCLNGGKCIQKDTCSCQKGYYGNRCEFST